MKKLPVGIQTFSEIMAGNYVYVDKTQYVYNLIHDAKYYFLSRPRRFGKSLLLDTIAEAFKGNKELFKGLWLYDSDYSFDKYPVIRLDMSSVSTENPEILKNSILSCLSRRIAEEELNINEKIPSDMFKHLIEGLYKKYNQKVVVLIDEYDKPILDHLTNIEMAEANRMVIRGFYGILKSMDPYLRFTFFTGVSKFTKASLFSELNNLSDITMSEEYANICGIPVESLDEHFGEHIESLKKRKRFQHYDNIQVEILRWYDGYSWDGETKLLNPFSLLSFFNHKGFSGFWYASGSPKFLLDHIKKRPESYTDLENSKITEEMLDSVDIDKILIGSLLFQTGYLTVKEIPLTKSIPVFIVDIPNFEVRSAFNLHILSALTDKDAEHTGKAKLEMIEALESGDLQKMLDMLRGLFAAIPYNLHINMEAYYHSILCAVMNVLGFEIEAEVSVSTGRVDAILELDDRVYIMEFKHQSCPPETSGEEKQKLFDKALNEGIKQINEKGYHKRYTGSSKPIYKAAFAFLGRDDIEMKVEM